MQELSNEFTKGFIDNGCVKIIPNKKFKENCEKMIERIKNVKIKGPSNEYAIEEFLCR